MKLGLPPPLEDRGYQKAIQDFSHVFSIPLIFKGVLSV